jgi:hypothetical protein
MIPLLLLASIGGLVPPGIVAPSRAVWIGQDAAGAITCELQIALRWSCEGISADAHGLVAIVGAGQLAYATREAAIAGSFVIRRWGRSIIVQPGAISDEDFAAITMTAWSPARSRFLTQSTRLVATADSSIDVIPIAPGLFWIAGDDVDRDAFVMLQSAGMATARIPIAMLSGNAEDPFYVTPALPRSLTGRIVTSRGDDVGDTDVELFEPTSPASDRSSTPDLLASTMIETGRVKSAADGSFVFDHVGVGPFLIVVTDASRGRGRLFVTSPSEPAVVHLTAPVRAIGRVLRGQSPAGGARVRFVPDAEAIMASADVRDLAAPERTTAEDGRFAFALPPVTAGMLQVVSADGASIRVPMAGRGPSGDIDFGDLVLPDSRRVAVRLDAEDEECVLSAVGPIGVLGLSIVRESQVLGRVHWLDLPEPGTWTIDADCGGQPTPVDPPAIVVAATGPDLIVDARVVRRH